MIDIFSYAGYRDKALCPFCKSTVSPRNFQGVMESYFCDAQCLSPLKVSYFYGGEIYGKREGELLTIQVKRDRCSFNFRLDWLNVEMILLTKEFDDIVELDLNHFNIESLRSDSWEDNIKTLLVFH